MYCYTNGHEAVLTPMTTTTPLRPETGFDEHPPRHERPDGLSRAIPFPEPHVEKIRGVKLIALWFGLAAGAWCIAAGVGYGLYVVVQTVL